MEIGARATAVEDREATPFVPYPVLCISSYLAVPELGLSIISQEVKCSSEFCMPH